MVCFRVDPEFLEGGGLTQSRGTLSTHTNAVLCAYILSRSLLLQGLLLGMEGSTEWDLESPNSM